MIGRREFITLLGGAATAWPLAARAQQPMPVIGFLHSQSPEVTDLMRGFRQGLKETGFVEGENLTIEYRWAENQFDRLPMLAADLVRRRVAAIAAFGSPAASAAKAATTTIPIVFQMADNPVRIGLVSSLARPAGNLTGVNFLNAELGGKRLALLRELVPGATRVALLFQPSAGASTETLRRDLEPTARAIGLQTQTIDVETSSDINSAFASFERERPDALFVGTGLSSMPAASSSRNWRRVTRSRPATKGGNSPKSAG